MARFDASMAAGEPVAVELAELDRAVEQPLGLDDFVDERDPQRLRRRPSVRAARAPRDAARCRGRSAVAARSAPSRPPGRRSRACRGSSPSPTRRTKSASATKCRPEPVHTPFTATIGGEPQVVVQRRDPELVVHVVLRRRRSPTVGVGLQVHAGAERARPRAGDDDRAHVRIGLHHLPGVAHVLVQLRASAFMRSGRCNVATST